MAKKQKLNLIEELTTHKNDFKVWPLSRSQAKCDARSREEPIVKGPPPFIPMDAQSHAPYRPNAHVPFDLFVERKPIVRTDPRECFTITKKIKEHSSNESAQLSTILSPTVPIDEIEEEEDLNAMLKYTYSIERKQALEEAALRNSKVPNPPNRVVPEVGNLTFKPNLYPALPPGWLGAANRWDCLQSRNLGDPFKSFWTRRGAEIECSCCCNPIPDMLSKETKDEISELINANKLSLAYDVTMTGYRGYRQICAKGVPLQKK